MPKHMSLKLGVAVLALSAMLAIALPGMPASAAPPDPGVVKLGIEEARATLKDL